MKKKLNGLFTTALVLAASTVSVASPVFAEEMTPVNVADLYIKTIINHDESSVNSLNNYLRPARKIAGQTGDFASFADLVKADKEYPDDMAKDILELFPAQLQPALKPSVMELMKSVLNAKNRTECKSLTSRQAKSNGGMQTSLVKFECQVVKVPERWPAAVQRLAGSKCSAQECQREIQNIRKFYESSATQTWRGEFPLAREKNGSAWRNDFPREALDEIWDLI